MSVRQREEELLAFAEEIRGYAKPTATPALRARLRRSLLTAPLPAPRRARWPLPLLAPLRPVLAAVLILAVLAGAGGSAAAASLPGDPAYGLKRAAESVELALAPDDAGRLDRLLTQSERRLSELTTAATQRPASVPAATDEYLAAIGRVDDGVSALLAAPPSERRDHALARARAASEAHLALLQSLLERLPAAAQPGIERAIEAQQSVHGRSGAPGREGAPAGSPTARPGGRPSTPPTPRR